MKPFTSGSTLQRPGSHDLLVVYNKLSALNQPINICGSIWSSSYSSGITSSLAEDLWVDAGRKLQPGLPTPRFTHPIGLVRNLLPWFKKTVRAINIDYALNTAVNNLIVFSAQWVIFIIFRLKSTQIREIGRMITQ